MANQSGSVYGLTILSPIKDYPDAAISHSLSIRMYLQTLPVDGKGAFGKVTSTHMARLLILDDVVYFGMPSCEEQELSLCHPRAVIKTKIALQRCELVAVRTDEKLRIGSFASRFCQASSLNFTPLGIRHNHEVSIWRSGTVQILFEQPVLLLGTNFLKAKLFVKPNRPERVGPDPDLCSLSLKCRSDVPCQCRFRPCGAGV